MSKFQSTISVVAALASIFGAGAAGWKLAQDNEAKPPEPTAQTSNYEQNINQLQTARTITGFSPLYKLQSSRIKNPTDITTITPMSGWIEGDKLWVDDAAFQLLSDNNYLIPQDVCNEVIDARFENYKKIKVEKDDLNNLSDFCNHLNKLYTKQFVG